MSPESEETRTEETVAELRAEIEQTRHEIDRTMSEIEQRLDPEAWRHMMTDRVREVATPWRDRPVEQAEALFHEAMTRLREMAWLNPLGLGLAAAAAGYLVGRRTAPTLKTNRRSIR